MPRRFSACGRPFGVLQISHASFLSCLRIRAVEDGPRGGLFSRGSATKPHGLSEPSLASPRIVKLQTGQSSIIHYLTVAATPFANAGPASAAYLGSMCSSG